MRTFRYHFFRATLITVAVAAGLAAVGLTDNDRAPFGLIALAIGVCLGAGAMAYALGGIHRARRSVSRAFRVPGGIIGCTIVEGVAEPHDVWTLPAGGHAVAHLGTRSRNEWRQLATADSPDRLRVLTSLMVGAR